jgi:hypothetical protein
MLAKFACVESEARATTQSKCTPQPRQAVPVRSQLSDASRGRYEPKRQAKSSSCAGSSSPSKYGQPALRRLTVYPATNELQEVPPHPLVSSRTDEVIE